MNANDSSIGYGSSPEDLQKEWESFESDWAALEASLPRKGPNCPNTSELLELALGLTRPEITATLRKHLESDNCQYCQRRFAAQERAVAQARELQTQAGERTLRAQALEAWSASDAKTTRVNPRDSALGAGISKRLFAAMLLACVAREQLRRLGDPVKCDTTGGNEAWPREKLTFAEDPDLKAEFFRERGNRHWLKLWHPYLPPDTLLQVRLENAQEPHQVWRRFLVLRRGFEMPTAELCLEELFADGKGEFSLHVDVLPERPTWTAADAEVLHASFQAIDREDPAAIPHWQAWAQSLFNELESESPVRSALGFIAKGNPAGNR